LGTYSGSGVSLNYNVEARNDFFWFDCSDPCESIDITITRNDGPGGYVQGNYSGTISGFGQNQQPITDTPISGSFSVLRE
jgi:hypothetical protein